MVIWSYGSSQAYFLNFLFLGASIYTLSIFIFFLLQKKLIPPSDQNFPKYALTFPYDHITISLRERLTDVRRRGKEDHNMSEVRSTLAYYDCFAGLVPCTAIAYNGSDLILRVNATRGAYKRGDVITTSKLWVIPRDRFHRSRRGPSYYYTTPYSWSEYALPQVSSL